MSADAKAIFNKLSQKQTLPHIKAAVLELEDKLRDPDFKVEEVAKILRREPLILGEVVRLADREKKARGGDKTPITSINHAVTYVGRQALADLVFVASLKLIQPATKDFNIDGFWQEALATALISQHLCRSFARYHSEDEAYLAGFLCNVGKVISAFYFPQEVDAVTRIVKNPASAKPWRIVETDCSFHDHRVLGEIACAFWGIPSYVLESVMKHHDLVPSPAKRLEIWEIVGFANQLTHWIRLEPQRIEQPLLDGLAIRFGLSPMEVDSLATKLDRDIGEGLKT
jgi:HD-like signal output (HDOD) protein